MTTESIIIFLLILVIVFFLAELRHSIRERRAAETIAGLQDRVNALGSCVDTVVKIIEKVAEEGRGEAQEKG
jgi:preprotein translocase subunit YajC